MQELGVRHDRPFFDYFHEETGKTFRIYVCFCPPHIIKLFWWHLIHKYITVYMNLSPPLQGLDTLGMQQAQAPAKTFTHKVIYPREVFLELIECRPDLMLNEKDHLNPNDKERQIVKRALTVISFKVNI